MQAVQHRSLDSLLPLTGRQPKPDAQPGGDQMPKSRSSVAAQYQIRYRPIGQTKGSGSPGAFLVTFCAYKKSPGSGAGSPGSQSPKRPTSEPPGFGAGEAPTASTEVRGAPPAFYASVSKIMVTGPSFSEVTSISAPNSPCSTVKPRSRHRAMKASYRGMAFSGLAAPVKPGRRLEVSA